jgi:hypothetical protein
VFEIGLLVGGFVVLFAFLPHRFEGDDYSRFADIVGLHHGHLSASPFSLVMPLVSSPLLLLGKLVRSPQWWAARFNVVFVAGGALVALRILRDHVDASLLRKLLLVLLFASFLTSRLRGYNAEVFTATLVAIGLVLITTCARTFAGWTVIVVGVVNTPAAFVGAALLASAEMIRTRRFRFLLAPAAAAILIMAESWIRRGGPLVSGEEHIYGVKTILPYSGKNGFSFPLVLGVLSIIFSFGRGLLFFFPGLLLGLGATTRRLLKECAYLVALMLLFVAGLVLVYAKWWQWYGGVSWGPRFFLFAALPASLFIAIRIMHAGEHALADAVALVVLTISGWIGVSGAIADPSALDVCTSNHFAHEALCWYAPEYSSLWQPILHFPTLTLSKALIAFYCALVFVYLATPLVAGLARAVPARLPRAWARGWRL